MPIWSDANIRDAPKLLKLRYSDILPAHLMQKLRDGALISPDELRQVSEAVQEMLDYLTSKFRNDPKEIRRAIVAHLMKKRK